MKLRLLAMATVAAAALSTPALAGEGWYLGLGGGWDHQHSIGVDSVKLRLLGHHGQIGPATAASARFRSATTGPTLAGVWKTNSPTPSTTSQLAHGCWSAAGGDQITSDMLNLVYDIPLGDTWKLSLGGGVGIGGFRGALQHHRHDLRLFRGGQIALPVAGHRRPAVAIAPDVDLFADYRYRENETDRQFRLVLYRYSPRSMSARSPRMW